MATVAVAKFSTRPLGFTWRAKWWSQSHLGRIFGFLADETANNWLEADVAFNPERRLAAIAGVSQGPGHAPPAVDVIRNHSWLKGWHGLVLPIKTNGVFAGRPRPKSGRPRGPT